MKVKSIYDSALRLLAESTADEDNEDYAERAPYILAIMCCELSSLDGMLRRSKGEDAASDFDGGYISLEDDFPLSRRFTSPASLYLASMLVLDSNEVLADSLYAKYSDAISRIYTEIGYTAEKITDRYFS